MPTIKNHDIKTGEEIEREMNAEELEKYQITIAEGEAEAEAQATKAAEKQQILDQLGITAEQAKLLLS